MGKPRLYVWSSSVSLTALRVVARPDIASSWSHSLGFLPRPGQGPDSAFITYCGYGEVVEFRMKGHHASPDGFLQDELGWKVVARVPASGEWLQVADADNDGRPEVCVATGYAPGKAALLLYDSPAPGAELQLQQRIDEGGRFGNVRFQVAELGDASARTIVAWWCTGLADGDAEMISYRLGPEGVRSRTVLAQGPASDLWPDDGDFVAGDLDGDGRTELWFATGSSSLWRYAPESTGATTSAATPTLVARFHEPIKALAFGPDIMTRRARLYIGHGRSIAALLPAHPGA
jgi:hypothetical protein